MPFLLIAIIYFMKYFIINPISSMLSHILARLFFIHPYIMKRRGNFICPSVNVCVHAHVQTQEAYSFKIWYRDTIEGFWEDLQAIFSKIYLGFLKIIIYKLYFHFTIFCIYAWYLKPISPKFGIEILKRNFETTSKRFRQKSF